MSGVSNNYTVELKNVTYSYCIENWKG